MHIQVVSNGITYTSKSVTSEKDKKELLDIIDWLHDKSNDVKYFSVGLEDGRTLTLLKTAIQNAHFILCP